MFYGDEDRFMFAVVGSGGRLYNHWIVGGFTRAVVNVPFCGYGVDVGRSQETVHEVLFVVYRDGGVGRNFVAFGVGLDHVAVHPDGIGREVGTPVLLGIPQGRVTLPNERFGGRGVETQFENDGQRRVAGRRKVG